MRLHEIILRTVRLPLLRPYRLSYRIFTEFEPIIVEVRSADGGVGWGDGLGSEIGCWMEACVARTTIRNAGEFNGFLKPKARLFANPLAFVSGALVLPAGFVPVVDRAVLRRTRSPPSGLRI